MDLEVPFVDSSGNSCSFCQCQGCSNLRTPHQPLNVDNSRVSHSYRSTRHGLQQSHSRKIQSNWYKIYPWLTVCTSVYCASCRWANSQGLLNFPKHFKPAFIDSGFANWRKALQKFREHEASSMHKEANLKLAAKFSGVGIDSAQHSTDQKHHRCMLLKLLHCIQYLSRQGLPFRGHKEDVDSWREPIPVIIISS